MAAPMERMTEDLHKIVDSWLQYGELSIIAKRQTAFNFAFDKRARTDVEHPWVVSRDDDVRRSEALGRRWEDSAGLRETGRAIAPAEANTENPKAVATHWEKKQRVVLPRWIQHETPTALRATPRGPTLPPPTGQATTRPAVAAGRTGVAPGGTTSAAGRTAAVVTTEAGGRAPEARGR
jgi:hypothetical protein